MIEIKDREKGDNTNSLSKSTNAGFWYLKIYLFPFKGGETFMIFTTNAIYPFFAWKGRELCGERRLERQLENITATSVRKLSASCKLKKIC